MVALRSLLVSLSAGMLVQGNVVDLEQIDPGALVKHSVENISGGALRHQICLVYHQDGPVVVNQHPKWRVEDDAVGQPFREHRRL